jgi:hypothetical protein
MYGTSSINASLVSLLVPTIVQSLGANPRPPIKWFIGNRIHSNNDIEKKSDRGPFQKLGITRRKYTIHETVHIAEIAKDN